MSAPRLLTTAAILNAQDAAFESLGELVAVERDHADYRALDDMDKAIRREILAEMSQCGCRCCRSYLPRLDYAGELDREERSEIEEADLHRTESARFERTLSAWVERTLSAWVERLHPGRPKREAA